MENMRVFVKSYGCSTNQADGETLAGCLAKAGHELASTVTSADVVVYNTCAVKGPTENRIIELLKRIPRSKKLIIAGCLPSIDLERLSAEVQFDGVVGPAAGMRIVDVVDRVLKGEKVIEGGPTHSELPELGLPRCSSSSVVSIVPISYGCLGSCAYCCVVFARGHLRSHSVEEIIQRVKGDLGAGFREFWLTSQDLACYGRDKQTNLANLLKALCVIDGDFRIRAGMMTPDMTMGILEDLLSAFEDDRIFKFVHLPVQSGDDKVLRLMRRHYSVSDFRSVVDAFRTRFHEVTLATDVICGFPGENETNFDRTLRLIEEVKPDITNVSKFFARPKTPAAAMTNSFIPLSEVKRRSASASALAKRIAFEKNQKWKDWSGTILVDEVGKVPGSWVGRNYAYKPITIKEGDNLFGKSLRVHVEEVFPTYLAGRLIR